MSVTLHDVCQRAHVSTATVSRVINQSSLVTADTRARVTKAIQILGYRPSYAARTLARQRTESLGVIFPEIAGGFFTEVLRGIDAVAAEHGFHLMTCFSHGQADEDRLVTRLLQERRVDALIWMNLSRGDGFVAPRAKPGTPIVLIDRPMHGTNWCSIRMDNAGGAEAATSHLLQHRRDHIAIITGPRDSHDAQRRLDGYRTALAKAGSAVEPQLVWKGEFTEQSGRAAMERWFGGAKKPPAAIFACNDAMALGALDVLREHGFRVPEDVAVVGFDDIESARHLGLTSVRVPMQDMGRAAAEAAIRQISGRQAQRQRVLPTTLVVRQSCGCAANRQSSREQTCR